MKKFLIILAIFLAPALALAGPGPISQLEYPASVTGLDGADLSASPSFTIQVGGYTNLAISWTLVRDASTDVTMVCYVGSTSTPTVLMTSSSAVATLGDITRTWSHTASTSRSFQWTTDINTEYIKCILDGTSASSSDLITVTARASAK